MKWRGAAIGGGATSGKLGPAVASRNKGGQYLRSRVVPSGATPTAAQEVLRNAIRSVSPSWSTLTSNQRKAWNTYGTNVPTVDVLGDTIQLSGQNWYVGSNSIRTQLAVDPAVDGPTTFDRGGVDFTGTFFTLGGSTGTLTLGSTPTGMGLVDGDVIAVYGGRDFGPGRSKYFGSFQLTTQVSGSAGTTTFVFNLAFAHDSNNQMAFNVVVSRADGRYTSPSRFTVSP